jgi:YaiO family outer membrane protein
MPGSTSRSPAWIAAAAAWSWALDAPRAAADPRVSVEVSPKLSDPVAVFAEGRAFASHGRYAEARRSYLWLLERDPANREVRLALARVDAWGGAFGLAEDRYRALLEERPHDVEARAGLIDVALWSGRWSEALVLIDTGLELDPEAAELWARRAKLLHWRGLQEDAVKAADHAEGLAPRDSEIRELRDALYVAQARASARVDTPLSHAYPDLYTADIQALNHWHRLELGIDALVRGRRSFDQTPIAMDGLYAASAAYHADGGESGGLSLGFGAPAVSVPAFQTKVWFSTPIGARWSGALGYSFWLYRDDKTVHIIAPSIGYAVSDWVLVELRAWGSYLVLQPPGQEPPTVNAQGTPSTATGFAVAVGGRSTWRVFAPLTIGASYTYGPQLDQAPLKYQLFLTTSHIVSVFADWLVRRNWGVQPILGFEHRHADNGAVVLIYSAEAASYFRW